MCDKTSALLSRTTRGSGTVSLVDRVQVRSVRKGWSDALVGLFKSLHIVFMHVLAAGGLTGFADGLKSLSVLRAFGRFYGSFSYFYFPLRAGG